MMKIDHIIDDVIDVNQRVVVTLDADMLSSDESSMKMMISFFVD